MSFLTLVGGVALGIFLGFVLIVSAVRAKRLPVPPPKSPPQPLFGLDSSVWAYILFGSFIALMIVARLQK
jgi:hypothetical protein